ncbi:hypothetical protein AAFX33_00995 [Vibrio chagasii]|uniref:hypothetical protein n=1 Tax=Vibrio chagasii TaxID=170679 RepID=UPI0038CD6045
MVFTDLDGISSMRVLDIFLCLMTILANRSDELRLAKKQGFDLEVLAWAFPEENNKIRKKQGEDG